MRFIFDIRKAIAAAGFICQQNEGSFDMLKLIKALYIAERKALVGWQRPITGDSFYSMENGPILSRIYDLIRGRVYGPEMDAWNAVFNPRKGDTVSLKAEFSTKSLSRREKEVLLEACEFAKTCSVGQIIDFVHTLPEWKNPGKSSAKIDPKTIFYHENKGEEAVEEIARDLADFMAAKLALQSRS